MSMTKRKMFARARADAKDIAAGVTDAPNLDEVAALIDLINQYAASRTAEDWEKIKAIPMPTGFIHSRLIGPAGSKCQSETFRFDGAPISSWKIAFQAEVMCDKDKWQWIGVEFLPTQDIGILQLSVQCVPLTQ